MSFRLSFHRGLLSPTGAHWLDDPPDVSCKENTRQYPVDGPLLSCKQQVGGSSPPASSQNRSSEAISVASGGCWAKGMSFLRRLSCRRRAAPLRYKALPLASHGSRI